ncbi:MAG TPA: Tex family protein [Cytophagaceae bacterium]|jgi:uncharacterized protein|nr:Tex family protein [Cytophagaceae bacterium]
MEQQHVTLIAKEISAPEQFVKATIELLEEGATVPFIARYRKEQTGSLDEVQVITIRDRHEQLVELDKRRAAILKSIAEQNKLTPELEKKINAALTMTVLEDLYLPYKQKRKTKGVMAKEKGLEPLSVLMLAQGKEEPMTAAAAFVNAELGVKDETEALSGARDIVEEIINEDAELRASLRKIFEQTAMVVSTVAKGKEVEGEKYRDYFEWSEKLSTVPSHRLLAMRRGEKEMILSLDVAPDEEEAINSIEKKYITGSSPWKELMQQASKGAFKRLLKPSLETEFRLSSKGKADEEAIRVFVDNVRQLLLSSPLGQKNILALDPGFRSGCKMVALDRQGKLIDNTNIYPHEPQRQTAQSGAAIMAWCEKYEVEAIAIGNGTAGRETEAFVKSLGLPADIAVVMVNESGASVYSASEVAREEFPDYDITVRGSVSIGRRLMDPLSELVKVDPKAIGVGQYQHDVDQSALKKSLDETVSSCVNAVGVEVNTASKQLLMYVSGIGPTIATNIVEYRNANGPFKSRTALKKVPRMGEKVYEQAVGFLRIRESEQPLDYSAVHPESYHIVEKMAQDLGVTVKDLIADPSRRQQIKPEKYITDKVGLPTLKDIMKELEKPGRDPRQPFEQFAFAEGINAPEDLRSGMKLPGIVTNVTKFGVFVDIGVHQDGLIHISHLADRFISDPSEVVKVQQKVQVTVLEVDLQRKRISLSMKGDNAAPRSKSSGHKDKLEKTQAPETDMAAMLAQLKGKFAK